MAKVTGYKCDVCNTVESTNERPFHWLSLKLPVATEGGNPEVKDICSDKCLLKFAKARNGVEPKKPGKTRTKVSPLSEYMRSKGIASKSIPGFVGTHVRLRHNLTGGREDCLVCQFETEPTVEGTNK